MVVASLVVKGGDVSQRDVCDLSNQPTYLGDFKYFVFYIFIINDFYSILIFVLVLAKEDIGCHTWRCER